MLKRLTIVFLLIAVLIGGFFSSGNLDSEDSSDPKVAVIVFDGADWDVIDQLREKDRLPEIQRMMDEGVYGDTLTPQAYSPITWTKIGTGLDNAKINPDSWNVITDDGDRRMIRSDDVENKRFWNYLNDAGISTGVTNYFLTWPVRPIDGFMVGAVMATSDRDLVYPEGKFNRSEVEDGNEWEIAEMVLNREKESFNFHTLGFKRVDGIQHALWKFIEPEKFGVEMNDERRRYREVVYDEYENIDDVISRFDDSWNVILVSDSGFEPEGGYKAESLEQFHAGKASSGFVYPTYEGNLDPLLRELGYAYYEEKEVLGDKVKEFDEEKTKMRWCSIDYPDPSYLNDTAYLFQFCIEDENVDAAEVISRLEEVHYPDGSDFFDWIEYNEEENTIEGVWRLREKYSETKIQKAYSHQPTFQGKTYEVDKALNLEIPEGESFKLWIGPEKSGDHTGNTHGIFLARGPDIADKGKVPFGNVRAVDIAPTILYMYGVPVPERMDGRPVTEIFTERFNEKRKVRYRELSTAKGSNSSKVKTNESRVKAMEERLKDLGYLN